MAQVLLRTAVTIRVNGAHFQSLIVVGGLGHLSGIEQALKGGVDTACALLTVDQQVGEVLTGE